MTDAAPAWLYVLCIPRFAARDEARIEAFRSRHEPDRARLVPAHVTLVFGVTSIAAADLIAHATRIAGEVAPFAITLDTSDSFADPTVGHFGFYLRVGEGAEILRALHDRFYRGALAGARRGDIAFVPHITIASAAQPVDITIDPIELPLPIDGRIDRLCVASLSGVALTVLAEVPLRAGRDDA